jgi:hypothetical protein
MPLDVPIAPNNANDVYLSEMSSMLNSPFMQMLGTGAAQLPNLHGEAQNVPRQPQPNITAGEAR